MTEVPHKLTLPAILRHSFEAYGDRPSMSLVGETPFSYKELFIRIMALTAFLEKLGVKKGDKIAILGTNMPNWGITYFAITSMGAVAIPLLPDFHEDEIRTALEHSETKIVFVSSGLGSKITDTIKKKLDVLILLDDFSVLQGRKDEITFNRTDVPSHLHNVEEEDLAVIIYTSGTAGRSKGVMLSHKNICFDAIQSKTIQPVCKDDRFLSILPLSHTYENTLGLVLPVQSGACIYYLSKSPTAQILLPALLEVRPTTMLTVPLIIEKIYFNKILPAFTEKRFMRKCYKIPRIRKILNRVAGRKLKKTFGGKLIFFGIGGAKLNAKVEQFLIEAKFPYAIGYGLTETAPLLAGANPSRVRLQSTGPAMEGVTLKIHDPNPKTGEGEIWAKGPNVMLGYYRDPETTRDVMTEDGWFKTGDLGAVDKDGFLYIHGRLKSLIVGASGENIYPEEIESVINNFHYVVESLVIEQKGRLVALVHFNQEEIAAKYQHLREEVSQQVEKKIDELRHELQVYVNSRVNRFSRVSVIIPHPVPFSKTATQKIKRFLYN